MLYKNTSARGQVIETNKRVLRLDSRESIELLPGEENAPQLKAKLNMRKGRLMQSNASGVAAARKAKATAPAAPPTPAPAPAVEADNKKPPTPAGGNDEGSNEAPAPPSGNKPSSRRGKGRGDK